MSSRAGGGGRRRSQPFWLSFPPPHPVSLLLGDLVVFPTLPSRHVFATPSFSTPTDSDPEVSDLEEELEESLLKFEMKVAIHKHACERTARAISRGNAAKVLPEPEDQAGCIERMHEHREMFFFFRHPGLALYLGCFMLWLGFGTIICSWIMLLSHLTDKLERGAEGKRDSQIFLEETPAEIFEERTPAGVLSFGRCIEYRIRYSIFDTRVGVVGY